MTTDSRQFPFQDLPAVAKEHVVRVMDGQERLTFSVLSHNANRMSRPLCQQAEIVMIRFDDGIKLRTDIEQYPTVTIELDGNFTLGAVYSTCKYIDGVEQVKPSHKNLNRPEYFVRDWIDHFMEFVRCQEVELLFLLPRSSWNVSSVLKAIQGLNIKLIRLCEGSGRFLEPILKHCPSVKGVDLKDGYSGDAVKPMLGRELEYFGITPRISLEEILLMKSKVMDIIFEGSNSDSINTLLVKWIAGWNPNFKAMILRYRNGSLDNIPDILTGIDYRNVEDNLDFSFLGAGHPFHLVGRWNEKAYQIQRNETGEKANLNFGVHGPAFLIKLVVQN